VKKDVKSKVVKKDVKSKVVAKRNGCDGRSMAKNLITTVHDHNSSEMWRRQHKFI